ncbi:MAG: hypothetical protein L0Z62_29495, partial [Gemmataceae bacterium]|nr:hypothetical protein [Gemmataceae bacterium]
MKIPSQRLVLRTLPLASRLTLAAFLVSVGIGYCSALVQLHFQHASPGTLLPEPEDAANAYYGRTGMSQLERLLVMDEGKPFNGSGSMRQTFTTKSAGWKSAINRRAKEKKLSLRHAEEELRSERDGERLAVLDWIRRGANQTAYEENNHVLSSHLVHRPITSEYVESGPDGTTRVKVASIVENRCARCHGEGKSGSAAQFPLDSWEQLHEYCEVETTEGGMSLKKLAQSTHVHLLGFAMLYGMTGLIFTWTSYPGWIRALLGPFTLLAQVVDISFWWLGRLDPLYARAIVFTGAAVAVGLFLQVVLSLFNLFGTRGK